MKASIKDDYFFIFSVLDKVARVCGNKKRWGEKTYTPVKNTTERNVGGMWYVILELGNNLKFDNSTLFDWIESVLTFCEVIVNIC